MPQRWHAIMRGGPRTGPAWGDFVKPRPCFAWGVGVTRTPERVPRGNFPLPRANLLNREQLRKKSRVSPAVRLL